VTHIRRTFGVELDIALDAQTRYNSTDIFDVVKYCEDNHVYWLEEPFTPDNIQAYQAIKRHTSIPSQPERTIYEVRFSRSAPVAGG